MAEKAEKEGVVVSNKMQKTVTVLIERRGKLPGQMLGKSPWLQSVHLLTDAIVGDVVDVDLVQAGPVSLAGRAITGQRQAARP